MNAKALLSSLVLFCLLSACQLTVAPPPTQPSNADVVGTAVQLTTVAKFTEMAGSAVPVTGMNTPVPTLTVAAPVTWTSTPTASGPCSPTVTATVNANVRSGPGTAYDAVGSLVLGQSATIVGRNDAYTWWYINDPSAGNYAWIAGSVVTASCVPAVVQVVAAPPTPTEEVANTDNNPGDDVTETPFVLLYVFSLGPDLVATSMQISPAVKDHPITVTVKIKNQGDREAKDFNIEWWATPSAIGCSWQLHSLAAGASTTLSCNDFVYHTAINQTVKLVVDSSNVVAESHEDNNTITRLLKISLFEHK